jgi:hypothetical protein
MKSFQDYKKNRQISEAEMEVVKNPKVKLVADYDGPTATAPDQGKSSVSYAPANKGESGFADLGAKDLVYNPVTKGGDSKTTALGTTIKNKEALGENTKRAFKAEAWFNKTKKMSHQDFIKECCSNIDTSSLPKISVNEDGQVFPSEVIRYVTILAESNPKTLTNLVHEMKREGHLTRLIEAILEHSESYEAISNVLSESKTKCRMLASYMYDEAVGPPLGMHNGDDFSSKLKGQDDDDHDDNDDDDQSPHDDDDEPHDEFGDDSDNDDDDDSDDDNDFDDDDNDDDDEDPHNHKKLHNHKDDDDSNGFDDDDDDDDDDDETFDNHSPFGKHEGFKKFGKTKNEDFKRLFKRLNN